MTMLGAQLDDLQGLSGQLQVMGGDVATVRDGSVATTSQVIGEVTQATATALQQITTHMEHLQTSVQTAVARAEVTQWTGANADRFRQGAVDFQSALAAGQATTRDAFSSFQSSAAMMSDTLQEFVTGFSAALTDASASASDMATAVEAQRANLDNVMNLGLSIN